MVSSFALRYRNDTLLGDQQAYIQLFQNPQGAQFEVVTMLPSKEVHIDNEPAITDHSWFPGFACALSLALDVAFIWAGTSNPLLRQCRI